MLSLVPGRLSHARAVTVDNIVDCMHWQVQLTLCWVFTSKTSGEDWFQSYVIVWRASKRIRGRVGLRCVAESTSALFCREVVMAGVCRIVGFALLLLLCHPGCLRGVVAVYWEVFSGYDIYGLQSLWGAWNESTPDTSSNLLNWHTPQANETPFPCYNNDKKRRGVTCLRYPFNDSQSNTWVVGLELRDASIVGALPSDIQYMDKLVSLDLSGNLFTGPPPKFNTLPNSTLYSLNLSRNNFTDLPDLSRLFNDWLPKSLGVVDLSGLNIGGRLPVDWNSSPDLLSLEMLYLDNINISGSLNIGSIQSGINSSRINNSTSRTLQVLSLRNNSITDVLFDKQFLKDGRITFYLHEKNKRVYALVKRFEKSDVRAKRFEYNELRAATRNFAEERKLGQGGFGAVYKGTLENNTTVAVKQLFMKTEQASEGFLNEILLITNLQHRNLVSLKGYCLHGKEMLLVYEFVDYCDLDKLLLQSSSVWQVLSWPARMHICVGVAQGLYYLHASHHTKIIHRDIKASNILLDKNLNAKIADFGLARPLQESAIMTDNRAGTVGYTAPEYMLYGQLSDKADVYSFGVLLLEIVSGTRNKDPTQSEDDIYLPTRAIKFHKEERVMEIIDPRLHVSASEALDVRRVLDTAVMCVQSSPERRPTMFRVVTMLAGDANEDSLSNVQDSNFWPEYRMPSESNTADPLLFMATSSSTTQVGLTSRPITNGNGSIELTSQFNGR